MPDQTNPNTASGVVGTPTPVVPLPFSVPVPVPPESAPLEKYRAWRDIFTWNNQLNWFLGVVSVVCSLAVASDVLKNVHYSEIITRVLSLIATVCTSMLAFFKPKEMSSAYRQAWRILDRAYRQIAPLTDGAKQLEILNAAVDEGEKVINSVDN